VQERPGPPIRIGYSEPAEGQMSHQGISRTQSNRLPIGFLRSRDKEFGGVAVRAQCRQAANAIYANAFHTHLVEHFDRIDAGWCAIGEPIITLAQTMGGSIRDEDADLGGGLTPWHVHCGRTTPWVRTCGSGSNGSNQLRVQVSLRPASTASGPSPPPCADKLLRYSCISVADSVKGKVRDTYVWSCGARVTRRVMIAAKEQLRWWCRQWQYLTCGG
jgi:hypothetical protein